MGPAIAVVGVTVLVGTVAVTELLFEIGDFSEGIGELLADGGIGGDKCTERFMIGSGGSSKVGKRFDCLVLLVDLHGGVGVESSTSAGLLLLANHGLGG